MGLLKTVEGEDDGSKGKRPIDPVEGDGEVFEVDQAVPAREVEREGSDLGEGEDVIDSSLGFVFFLRQRVKGERRW